MLMYRNVDLTAVSLKANDCIHTPTPICMYVLKHYSLIIYCAFT
jgi:hypothetical protein